MSVKHYKPATASERAALKKRAEKEKNMTPAQKKRASTMSTPLKIKKATRPKAKKRK